MTFCPAGAPIGTRRSSGTLSRYIAREFLIPLVCCLGGFVALFLVADVFDVLQDFLELDREVSVSQSAADSPIAQLMLYLLLRQPANLVNVLPMSILLSTCFMMNILGRHHEITALRASGLSLPRCCLPVWLIALVCSGLSFWLSESIAPDWSATAAEVYERRGGPSRYLEKGRGRLAYRNVRGSRDWFFECFSRDGVQQGVLVKQFRDDGSIHWELRAARAAYEEGRWVFNQGTMTQFDEQGRLPQGPQREFARYAASELTESPGQILNSLKPAEELSVSEIVRLIRDNACLPRSTRNVFYTTLWHRLSFPFSCLVAALLGVSLSVAREGSSALRGFAMAVGIMVFYYLVGQFFLVLGKNGAIPSLVAGLLPTLCFAAWGGCELYRRR